MKTNATIGAVEELLKLKVSRYDDPRKKTSTNLACCSAQAEWDDKGR